jgi:XapX domain-containing protein
MATATCSHRRRECLWATATPSGERSAVAAPSEFTEDRPMTDLLLALALGLGIGLGCRWFDLPLPAPPRLVGALLVVAMTLGFMGMDMALGSMQ